MHIVYVCVVCTSLCVVCLTVFVISFVEPFAICLGVVVILLLYVLEVSSVGGGALLDRPCIVFQIIYLLYLGYQCAPMCSFHRFCGMSC